MDDTVLILGANGRFGRAAVAAFAAAGWRVRAQTRRAGAPWPMGVEEWRCDALDAPAVARAADGAAVVVNGLNPLYTEWERLARPLADAALAAARGSGALLMSPGVIYNFGRKLPPALDEQTPQLPDTPKARIRIGIERAVASATADGVNSVVLRAGDYFGGGARGGWFDSAIVKGMTRGRMVYPGPLDRSHAWAYLPDFAETFVRLAARRQELVGARQYHFSGYGLTGSELHQALERATGRALHLGMLPWWSLRLSAPFSPMSRALLQMRYLWWRPHRLQDGALEHLLGPLPATPVEEALAVSVRELGLWPEAGGV